MGRKAQVSYEDFIRIKEIIVDIPRGDKETLASYAEKISKYSGRDISTKTLSRILRSETYDDYKRLLKEENQKKEKNAEPVQEMIDLVVASDPKTDDVKDILERILKSVSVDQPVGGSSIDALARNICSSVKRVKEAIEKQTEVIDAHLGDLNARYGELYELIDKRFPAKLTSWEELHKDIKEAAQ